mgnify:CR=1 FL=1
MELCTLLNNYFEVTQNEGTAFLKELKQMKEKINEDAYTTC